MIVSSEWVGGIDIWWDAGVRLVPLAVLEKGSS